MIRKLIEKLILLKFYGIASFLANVKGKTKNTLPLKYTDSLWLYKSRDFSFYDKDLNFNVTQNFIDFIMKDVYYKNIDFSIGNCFIDVGAGIGTEIIYLSKKVNPSAKIYAIEASPVTFNILKKNIALNKCNNVHLFQIAINDKGGQVFIDLVDSNHIKARLTDSDKKGKVSIDALTIDQFIGQNNINSIDLLKVNIEGAEQLMIKSFDSINIVKKVAISCHDFLGKNQNDPWLFTKDKVQNFLENHDFEIQTNQKGIPYVDDWLYGSSKR